MSKEKYRPAERMEDIHEVHVNLQRSIYFRLKESLEYHDLTMTDFVRIISKAFLEEDGRLLGLIDDYKQADYTQTKRERFFIKHQKEKKKEQIEELTDKEIDELYSIMEDESVDIT